MNVNWGVNSCFYVMFLLLSAGGLYANMFAPLSAAVSQGPDARMSENINKQTNEQMNG